MGPNPDRYTPSMPALGALMTADGSDYHLIKLEGTPVGYKLVIPSTFTY